MPVCEEHRESMQQISALVTSMAVLNASFSQVKDKISTHIDDGEKQGGFRDRLVIIEHTQKEIIVPQMNELKKNIWSQCILAGLLGGLIGHITPQIFELLVKVAFASMP